MRTGWRIIGSAAAALGTLNLLLLVGFSVVGVVSPDSVESSGPSPWLVLTPWILGLFAVARWSFRRAGRAAPNAVDGWVSGMTRSVDNWERSRPILAAAVLGTALGIVWSLAFRSVAGLLVGVMVALTRCLTGRARRARTPQSAA
jgi:hypothetical protein